MHRASRRLLTDKTPRILLAAQTYRMRRASRAILTGRKRRIRRTNQMLPAALTFQMHRGNPILLTGQTFRLSRTNRVQQKMRSPMVCSVPKKKVP